MFVSLLLTVWTNTSNISYHWPQITSNWDLHFWHACVITPSCKSYVGTTLVSELVRYSVNEPCVPMYSYEHIDQWCSHFSMIMPTSPAEQAAHVSNLEASYIDEQHVMIAMWGINNVNGACNVVHSANVMIKHLHCLCVATPSFIVCNHCRAFACTMHACSSQVTNYSRDATRLIFAFDTL